MNTERISTDVDRILARARVDDEFCRALRETPEEVFRQVIVSEPGTHEPLEMMRCDPLTCWATFCNYYTSLDSDFEKFREEQKRKKRG